MRARLLRYAFVLALVPTLAAAQSVPAPYRVIKTAKVGGVGGFDYVSADAVRRHLYVARLGTDSPRLTVFNLDTLAPVSNRAGYSGPGAAVDHLAHHGFAHR